MFKFINNDSLKRTIKATLFNQIICFGMLTVFLIELNFLKIYTTILVYIIGMTLCYLRELGYFDSY